MNKAEASSDAPLIGDFDQALLTEIRVVVAVVFALGLALLLGWTALA